jgi:hypothetical protein
MPPSLPNGHVINWLSIKNAFKADLSSCGLPEGYVLNLDGVYMALPH